MPVRKLENPPKNQDDRAPDATEVAPGVFVVRHRPVGFSAGLVPPLLLVILGASFLVYRSAASDWRGIFALLSGPSRDSAPLVKEAPALVLNDPPKPEAAEVAVAAAAAPAAPADASKDEPVKPKVTEPANPLEDIKREAEKTKEKIAELERLKEEEKTKQDRTAPARKKLPTLREQKLAEQRDRMIAGQRDLLRRQMSWMAEMQERQMREMANMQRRFMSRDFAGMPFPRFDGMADGGFLPGRQPQVPPRGLGNAPWPPQPGNLDDKEVVQKTPDGVRKFRRFQGPNGAQGFTFEFRSNDPLGVIPPPPEPKKFD
jgi:hypothetical protein